MEKLIDALKKGENVNISELCPDLTTEDIKKLFMSALMLTASDGFSSFTLEHRKKMGILDSFKEETERKYYKKWLKDDKKFDYVKERVLNLEVDPYGEENWEESKSEKISEKKLDGTLAPKPTWADLHRMWITNKGDYYQEFDADSRNDYWEEDFKKF